MDQDCVFLAHTHWTSCYTLWSLHVNPKQVEESVQKAHVVALRWLDPVSGTVQETTAVVHPDANRQEVSCVELRLDSVFTATHSDLSLMLTVAPAPIENLLR